MSVADSGLHAIRMQGQLRVKIVPRVLFELDQAGLLQLLSKPHAVTELLVNVCQKHGFDGLVSWQCVKSVCRRKLMRAHDFGPGVEVVSAVCACCAELDGEACTRKDFPCISCSLQLQACRRYRPLLSATLLRLGPEASYPLSRGSWSSISLSRLTLPLVKGATQVRLQLVLRILQTGPDNSLSKLP